MPLTPAITDKFTKVGSPGSATTLAAPGYTQGNASINVGATTNWQTETLQVFAIDRAQVVNGAEVRIANTYNEFVGIVTSATVISSLTKRYGTNQDYAAGSLTRVYIPVSSTRENDLIDGLTAEHDKTGAHAATMVTARTEDTTPDYVADYVLTYDASATGLKKVRFDNLLPAGIITPYGGATAPSGWLLCDGAAVSRTTYARLFAALSTAHGVGDGSTTFNLPDLRGRTAVGVGTGTFAEVFAAAAVTVATDLITVSAAAGRQFINGTPVVLTSAAAPGGLVTATTYYVIAVSATTIKLASTLANAVAGTPIDITSQGTGNHTLTLTLSARALADRGGEENHALTTNELTSHNHQVILPATSTAGGILGYFATNNTGTAGATSTATGGSAAHNVMNPYVAVNYIIKT